VGYNKEMDVVRIDVPTPVNTPVLKVKDLSKRSRIQYKKKLICKILNGVDRKKNLHKKRSMKYKNIDNIFDGILVALSTMTLSSVMLQYMDASPWVQLTSAIFGSLNMVGSTVKKTVGLSNKWSESKGIYTALNDLSREITILLARNHLTSDDLDVMMNDLHHRLSLIEDRSPLVGDGQNGDSQIMMTLSGSPNNEFRRISERFLSPERGVRRISDDFL